MIWSFKAFALSLTIGRRMQSFLLGAPGPPMSKQNLSIGNFLLEMNMNSRTFLLGALVMVLLAGAVPLSWSSSIASSNDKIASRVLSDTANGASTEALVVITEQADLSPAYSMKTKLEKGTFVFNALRTVANRTQGPILDLLKQRGIPYQSFYIVNMIKVTGDRNLMEELAARSDVARIDANPYVRTALPSSDGKGRTSSP